MFDFDKKKNKHIFENRGVAATAGPSEEQTKNPFLLFLFLGGGAASDKLRLKFRYFHFDVLAEEKTREKNMLISMFFF